MHVSPSVTRWGMNPAEMEGCVFIANAQRAPDQRQCRCSAKLWMHPDDIPVMDAAFGDASVRSLAAGGAAACFAATRHMKLPSGYTLVRSSGCIKGDQWYSLCRLLGPQLAKEEAMRSLLLSISHELRTPAQSGLAAAQLLAQRSCVRGDQEAAFLVQAISASCGLLLGMVSNVLSMRHIESGTLDMRIAPFDPRAAVNELLQVCRVGCHTRITWPEDEAALLPATVEGDHMFFIQILQNLVRDFARHGCRWYWSDACCAFRLQTAPSLRMAGAWMCTCGASLACRLCTVMSSRALARARRRTRCWQPCLTAAAA